MEELHEQEDSGRQRLSIGLHQRAGMPKITEEMSQERWGEVK